MKTVTEINYNWVQTTYRECEVLEVAELKSNQKTASDKEEGTEVKDKKHTEL